MCTVPPAVCELFLPFNRSIAIILTTNVDLGRESPKLFANWNRTLHALRSQPQHLVAATDVYDLEVAYYFTGVRAEYIPFWYEYVRVVRNVTKAEVLLGASKVFRDMLLYEHMLPVAGMLQPPVSLTMTAHLGRSHCRYTVGPNQTGPCLEDGQNRYSLKDLSRHPAIALIPYTYHTMLFGELYTMAMPIFLPAISLLTRWNQQYDLMCERVTWPMAREPLNPPHPFSPSSIEPQAVAYWMRFSELYRLPHVQYFSSFGELFNQLRYSDLDDISSLMQEHNVAIREQVVSSWQAVYARFQKFRSLRENVTATAAAAPPDFYRALREQHQLSFEAEGNDSEDKLDIRGRRREAIPEQGWIPDAKKPQFDWNCDLNGELVATRKDPLGGKWWSTHSVQGRPVGWRAVRVNIVLKRQQNYVASDSITLGGDDDFRLFVSANGVDITLHGEGCEENADGEFRCEKRFITGQIQQLAPRPYIVWSDGSLWERIAGSTREISCLPDYSHRCPLLWTENVHHRQNFTECVAPSSYATAKGSPCAPLAIFGAISQGEKALWALDCEVLFPCKKAPMRS